MLKRFIPIFVIAFSVVWSQDKPVAIAVKTSGQVTFKNRQDQTVPLKPRTQIFISETIVTGSDGLAVVIFLDDKSTLRIQKNTTLTIAGERTANAINKQIDMQFGQLRAEVARQRKGDFSIVTPTSVASVKGTILTVIENNQGTIVIVEREKERTEAPTVVVTNKISGNEITVNGGQMGTSDKQGNTEVVTYVLLKGEILSSSRTEISFRATEGTDDMTTDFNGRIIINNQTSFAGPDPEQGLIANISGTANDDGSVTAVQVEVESPEETVQDTGTVQTNEIRIQFRDADGNLKEIVITYQ